MIWVYKNNEGNFDYIQSPAKPNSGAQSVPMTISWSDRPWFVGSESQEPILDEEGNQIGTRTVYSVTVDEGQKAADLAARQAQNEALNAFKLLNNEIETDAANTAGTTNQISALMDYLTYIRMKNSPALFDQEGIVAKKAVGTFTQGAALDTALKIEQYAEFMLAESDAFMIRRLKKITDYILNQ